MDPQKLPGLVSNTWRKKQILRNRPPIIARTIEHKRISIFLLMYFSSHFLAASLELKSSIPEIYKPDSIVANVKGTIRKDPCQTPGRLAFTILNNNMQLNSLRQIPDTLRHAKTTILKNRESWRQFKERLADLKMNSLWDTCTIQKAVIYTNRMFGT